MYVYIYIYIYTYEYTCMYIYMHIYFLQHVIPEFLRWKLDICMRWIWIIAPLMYQLQPGWKRFVQSPQLAVTSKHPKRKIGWILKKSLGRKTCFPINWHSLCWLEAWKLDNNPCFNWFRHMSRVKNGLESTHPVVFTSKYRVVNFGHVMG